MNQRSVLLAFILIGFLLSPTLSSAQTDQKYWHSNDHYSVELDGEGDAFVVANIQLESISEENVSSITLEIPNRNVKVYKIIQNPQNYKRYYDEYEMNSQFLDFNKETLSDSAKLNITLSYKLTPESETSITLIYKSNEIASKEFRGLNYNFETIKDPNALTRQVGANIRVPDHMQIKGKGDFEVDYKPSMVAEKAMSSASAESLSTMYYPHYRNSQYSASNLDPGESFTISGLYGESFFKLYLFEILGGISLLIFLGVMAKGFQLGTKIKQLYR